MPVIEKRNSALGALLVVSALCCGLSSLPACSLLNAHSQSTVAQGKYYASGNTHYDEFFVGLYLLQVQMEQAPHVPELERLSLAHALGLTPRASSEDVGQRLHDEAQKQSRSGLRMRLDQHASSEKPDTASAAVRTNERPQESATVALLGQIETSATGLLRSLGELKQADEALDGLELAAGGLDASVDKDFASEPAAKLHEVKLNLVDAHQLIALMKARANQVRSESEQLLSTIAKAIDTDDGSLGSASEAPSSAATSEAAKGSEVSKKPTPKAYTKPKPKPASAAPAVAAHPKAAPEAESDAPAKAPAKAGKAPPAPRDFEP
jgi:hypothetical protein